MVAWSVHDERSNPRENNLAAMGVCRQNQQLVAGQVGNKVRGMGQDDRDAPQLTRGG